MNLPLCFTLVTPTGDRPEAFALCEQYMERQTLPWFQWIVLDDGDVPTSCTCGQEYVRCPEYKGRASLVRKIRHVLEKGIVRGEALAIIEDDDWYAPNYLATQDKRLAEYDVAGEGRAIYYNVAGRWWYGHPNMGHASLCQTVVRREALDVLLSATCESEDPFIDVRLWSAIGKRGKVFDPEGRHTLIGIKGMPGRAGYGCGHRGHASAKSDPNLSQLKTLIGEDATNYEPYFKEQLSIPEKRSSPWRKLA